MDHKGPSSLEKHSLMERKPPFMHLIQNNIYIPYDHGDFCLEKEGTVKA